MTVHSRTRGQGSRTPLPIFTTRTAKHADSDRHLPPSLVMLVARVGGISIPQLARTYDKDVDGLMFKDSDFSEEDLSKYAAEVMSAGMGSVPPGADVDLTDPAVRVAFGLDADK